MGRSMLSEVNTWWIFLRCSASGKRKQMELFSRFSRDQRLRRSAAEMSSLCWRLASSPLSMSQLVEKGGVEKLIKWSFGHFCVWAPTSKRVSSAEGRLRGSKCGSVQVPQLGRNQLWQQLPKQGVHQARFLVFWDKTEFKWSDLLNLAPTILDLTGEF